MSVSVSLRLSDKLAKKVAGAAKKKKTTKTAVIEEVLSQYFVAEAPQTPYEIALPILKKAWAAGDKGLPVMGPREQEEFLRNTMGRKRARPS